MRGCLPMAAHDLRPPFQLILSAFSWPGRHHPAQRERQYIERGESVAPRLTSSSTISSMRCGGCTSGGHYRALASRPSSRRAIFVRNAIKYLRQGSRILLGCRRHGSDVRIGVHDAGIAIRCISSLGFDETQRLALGLFVVRVRRNYSAVVSGCAPK
jgi:hypothetical protein